ncbi:cation:proton antiporter regulatory subunit [Meiothermus hypogaeus]|uniref:Potassium transporter TrkA n=2 Tax=Meiothermus hypogaeus TaxID=884155 RepID=A0A511QYN6_9DEIN|nr:TrkA C-terminal domain-containing protein [Meiothermus hypogaeus]RIH80994.1 K(+)/H(+) antiporter subunit KhtT [Meiothermus hypogaeus]GEM82510.1 potassium transporter TrkA [Meiothermus hypogaeus NBRC 106114]
MRVEESVLPGVGRKFTITVRSGDRLVIVIHHSGSRELQYFEQGSLDEPSAVLDLTDEEARELGAILGGVLFTPQAIGDTQTKLAQDTIEWVKLNPGAPCIGRTARELHEQGAHLLAVLREGEALIPNPPPELSLRVGDTLVVAGPRGAVERLRKQMTG